MSMEDNFIPMEADDFTVLREQRKTRDRYWAMLYESRKEFRMLSEQARIEYDVPSSAFFRYLKENYGLQVETVDGLITSDYSVVDEKKYLMFLMKFGS